jgi:diamine N-acetyltransferase
MITLCKATTEDIPLIFRLADAIWRVYYPPIIGMAQMEYMLEKMYASDALAKQMQEGQVFWIILSDEHPAGFLAVSEKEKDELFLHKFYIDPAQQGKGIGEQVFHDLLLKYPDKKQVTLTVNRQNFRSVNFYFKIGFRIDHVADFDIGDGYVMNDFVMVYRKK